MKIIYLLVCLSFFLAFETQAQQATPNLRNPVLDEQFFIVREWISPKEKSLKTVYLFDTWNKGTIYLKNKQSIKGYKLNYDMEKDLIEIETKEGIKVLPGDRVKQFNLEKPGLSDSMQLVNTDAFPVNNVYNFGFYEIVNGGSKMQLLVKTDVEIIRANYNMITNSGSKTDKIVKKEKIYLAENNKVTLIKANDFEAFGRKAEAVEKYAKTHKLKLKRPEDAAKLVNYYNSI
ncbi:hypothetical protein I5M27_03265 [Adhaeribacter sp. BT258]|uniref:Uncharacterized protein n=1 Tax=Adhaeribacter terrigena TaxID=2793070 RepID=A0ABS1C068_9BACT|nr:hypothetical protein [Adhaeribacter terrigena]MBK0401988.1 hypothetical protein [Adhaeribacter terrigena]